MIFKKLQPPDRALMIHQKIMGSGAIVFKGDTGILEIAKDVAPFFCSYRLEGSSACISEDVLEESFSLGRPFDRIVGTGIYGMRRGEPRYFRRLLARS